MTTFTPREIVSELDRFIVGQNTAKRAVAIALRNRWRRQQIKGSLKEEVLPKNILMIGPTGVGKTEIAKILSQILKKPLIRLQCYEGLDINQAAYEWNYGQQIIALQSGNKEESDLFSKKYLIERQNKRKVSKKIIDFISGRINDQNN